MMRVLLGGWNTWKQENAKDPTGYPTGGTGETGGAVAPPPAGDTGNQVPATIELQAAPANTVAPSDGGGAAPPGLVPIPGKTP